MMRFGRMGGNLRRSLLRLLMRLWEGSRRTSDDGIASLAGVVYVEYNQV
jgi:hypothetical protein